MTLPAVPDTFRWTQETWGPALRCRPLEVIAPHLFTTRQLALSSRVDWARVAAAIGAAEIATLTQVHGRDVVVIRSPKGPRHIASHVPRRAAHVPQRASDVAQHFSAADVAQRFSAANRPDADVLASDDPTVALAVRAADCVPMLLGDARTGAVAAVHAGWRGTAARAAPAAVEALAREFGAAPRHLVVAIGPSIGVCCYEVGPEIAGIFLAAGHPPRSVERWFITPPSAAKPRLDTWAANRDQLMNAGVLEENIHICGLCTASNLELFPSFRAEKERAGRMAGVIRAGNRAA